MYLGEASVFRLGRGTSATVSDWGRDRSGGSSIWYNDAEVRAGDVV